MESPRQPYNEWAKRAQNNLNTLFVSVTADLDLPRESQIGKKGLGVGKGYGHTTSTNWVNINLKDPIQKLESELTHPLSIPAVSLFKTSLYAHSLVTDYGKNVRAVVRNYETRNNEERVAGNLGNIVSNQIMGFISHRPSYRTSDNAPQSPKSTSDAGGVIGYIRGKETEEVTGKLEAEGKLAKEALEKASSESIFAEY